MVTAVYTILILANFDPTRSFGTMRRTQRILKGLTAHGWAVSAIYERSRTPGDASEWIVAEARSEVVETDLDYASVELLDPTNLAEIRRKESRKAIALDKVLKHSAPDCAWMPFPSHEFVSWALGRRNQAKLVREAGIPLVLDVQGVEARLLQSPILQFGSLTCEIRAVCRCDGAVFVDRYPWRVFADFVPGPSALIPNGIDTDFFRPGPNDRQETVTFVGRLSSERGIWTFLRAARELRGRNIPLVVAGSGPDYVRALRFCRANDLDVRFVGLLRPEDLLTVYRQSMVIANPLEIDGVSLASLEGMACGTAVVKSRDRSGDDLLGHGETALLVKRGDWKSLAEVIAALVDDAGLRKRLAKAGRAYVVENHSSTSEIDRIEKFLERVVR